MIDIFKPVKLVNPQPGEEKLVFQIVSFNEAKERRYIKVITRVRNKVIVYFGCFRGYSALQSSYHACTKAVLTSIFQHISNTPLILISTDIVHK
jgi:hypothetical protein